jgi:hypothetical protein
VQGSDHTGCRGAEEHTSAMRGLAGLGRQPWNKQSVAFHIIVFAEELDEDRELVVPSKDSRMTDHLRELEDPVGESCLHGITLWMRMRSKFYVTRVWTVTLSWGQR